jgi:hypothetical protein
MSVTERLDAYIKKPKGYSLNGHERLVAMDVRFAGVQIQPRVPYFFVITAVKEFTKTVFFSLDPGSYPS